MATNDHFQLEMNDLMIRFPHLMEQILQKLDNESLVKSKGVAKIWKEFINNTKYPWVRIVKIPTILQGGDTYLHLAAKHNQIVVFEEILNGEAEKDIVNDSGYSPFLVACLFGSLSIAEFLMRKYEELKIDLSRLTNCHSSAFHLACIGGNSKLAEMIMKNSVMLKIHLNEDNPFDFMSCGRSGFHYAIRYGNLEVVKMLIENSTSMNIKLNTLDKYNNTGLHIACSSGHAKIAKVLIKESTKLKLDLNAQDVWGYTAFHMACKSGLSSIVKIMIDQSLEEYCASLLVGMQDGTLGNDPRSNKQTFDLSLKTKDAETGFHFACRAGHTKIVEMLIDVSETLKLDLASKNITVENAYTGFQLADAYGETNVVELIKSKMPSLVVYQNPKRKRGYGMVPT